MTTLHSCSAGWYWLYCPGQMSAACMPCAIFQLVDTSYHHLQSFEYEEIFQHNVLYTISKGASLFCWLCPSKNKSLFIYLCSSCFFYRRFFQQTFFLLHYNHAQQLNVSVYMQILQPIFWHQDLMVLYLLHLFPSTLTFQYQLGFTSLATTFLISLSYI